MHTEQGAGSSVHAGRESQPGAAGTLAEPSGRRTTPAVLRHWLRRSRPWLVDVAVVAAAIVGALVLLYDPLRTNEDIGQFFPAALLPLLVMPLVNVVFGVYRRAWAYATVAELARLSLAVAAGSAVGVLIFYALLVPLQIPGTAPAETPFPRSFFVIQGLLALAGMGAAQFLMPAISDWRYRIAHERSAAQGTTRIPTLVYGAGRAGAQVLRTISNSPDGLGMRVVGFVDDDPGKQGFVVRGVLVMGGLVDLEHVVHATGARRLLVAIPTGSGDVIRRVVEQAHHLGLETRTLPPFADLVSGRLSTAAIREIKVDDLLRRSPVAIDESGLRSFMTGETVLVTGAGGSIGSELCRQVFDLDPARLVLLDRAEGALYNIERELALVGQRDSGSPGRGGHHRAELVTHLANVASLPTMSRLVAGDAPGLVLHAAAYKHVPMMERHPADAVYTNVGGTLAALRASSAAGVERFVLVSTDKAVEPSSVMGATKRLAEHAVAAMAARTGRRYSSVRFGNVLGSSGSVVPLFQQQLAEGVPLTITDAEMTRFFMTIPEASRLILEAALMGEPGDLFVLDMGEPVRILDLARDLARLAGRDPDSVPIEYIGLRPGEKLHESLFYDREATEPTMHPKVIRVRAAASVDQISGDPDCTLSLLDDLVAVGASGDHDRAHRLLFETLATLEPGRSHA